MDKKYQVFISSTYKDMKAERQAAVEAILDAGHIPAGMELFAASDKAQMEVIKGWIDESDIFMLILGGRYGSIEPESDKIYIQLEYEYAVATGKPFFSLYLTDTAINEKVRGPLGADALEQVDSKKLNDFRAVVQSKLCAPIDEIKDIQIKTPKSIHSLAAKRDLVGWVRASNVPELAPLLNELKVLREENDALKRAAKLPSKNANAKPESLVGTAKEFSPADLNGELALHLDYIDITGTKVRRLRKEWNGTYLDFFSKIAAKLLEDPADRVIRSYVEEVLSTELLIEQATLDESEFQSVKLKLVSFGVTELNKAGNNLRWSLTENGKGLMMKLH